MADINFASSCMTLTSGICRGCRDNVGGIKKAWLIDVCELGKIDKFTLNAQAPGEIQDYTLLSAFTSLKWFVFTPNKHTGNYVETINVSVENGTIYYNGVLTLPYTKGEQYKLNQIFEMGKGDLAIIFLDENNKYWLLGGVSVVTTNGYPTEVKVDTTAGVVIGGTSFQTGTAMADANGGSLTFTVDMAHPAMEIIPKTGGTLATDLQTAESGCGCPNQVTPTPDEDNH